MKYSKEPPANIFVIGAGGTGGYIIPHLYRICFAANRPTRVVICDGDIVEAKNLIRQNFIGQDIGQNKAKVLSERYASAFGIETEYISSFIESEEELAALLRPDNADKPYYDKTELQKVILIGAVDNNKSRKPPPP